MQIVEWWRDYGRSPLWLRDGPGGAAIDGAVLGLDEGLAARLSTWCDAFAESNLPIDGAGDEQWIETGTGLLAEVRSALAGRYEVVVTEPWWGEAPTEV